MNNISLNSFTMNEAATETANLSDSERGERTAKQTKAQARERKPKKNYGVSWWMQLMRTTMINPYHN